MATRIASHGLPAAIASRGASTTHRAFAALVVTLALVGAFALLELGGGSPDDEPDASTPAFSAAPAPPAERGELVPHTAPGSHGFQVVVNSEEFIQGVSFGLEDENALYVRNRERAGPQYPWDETISRYSSSFEIHRVASRVADDFFVLGRASNQDWVIERWTITPPKGSYFMTRQQAGGTQFGIVGGTYLPPELRTSAPSVTRRELYRGQSLGKVLDIDPDPEGRFLLLLVRDEQWTSLRRMDLQPGAPVTTLIAEVEVPELAQMDSMDTREHEVQGRLFLLMNIDGPFHVDQYVVLHDADRDGQIDPGGIDTFDFDELRAAGYYGAVWSEDFINYLD